jgi:hypothetical protein
MTNEELPISPEAMASQAPSVWRRWRDWPQSESLRQRLAGTLILGLIAFAVWVIHHAYGAGFLMGWDSMGHAVKVAYLREVLLPMGRWDGWFPYWHCGFQLFQFYPPGFYAVTALASFLPGVQTSQAFNAMATASYLVLPVSLYLSLRAMGMGRTGALASATIAPFVGSTYGGGLMGIFAIGLIPNTWGIALLPAVIAMWYCGLTAPSRLKGLGMATLTAALVLTHTFSTYVAAVAAAVFVVYRLAAGRWRQVVPYAGMVTVGIICLSSAWLVPTLLKYAWHGMIGNWTVPKPVELTRGLLTGTMFSCHTVAWLGLPGIIIGIWRGGFRRELATYTLIILAMTMGVINRFMPFGDVVASSQYVRFQGYLGLCLLMMAGITVEALWAWLRALPGRRALAAWAVPLLVVGLLGGTDWTEFYGLRNWSVRTSAGAYDMRDVTAMMETIKGVVQPHERLLAEFDWNAQWSHGTPHALDQALPLWGFRADLGGNFSEGSRVSAGLDGINLIPYSNANFLEMMRQYGVSYLVTFSLNHDRQLAKRAAFVKVANHGTVSLWRLREPGQILYGAKPLTVASYLQEQDRLDVALDNPEAGNKVTLTYNAYPNWYAYWNDQPLTWTETKEAFMQVQLPKGKGTLSWRYQWYPVERICDGVATVAWLICLVLAIRWRRHAAAAHPAV